MRILVVGGGGREHALCWAISASPLCTELLCAPGNAGIARLARCIDVPAEDVAGQVALAQREKVDFVVVGPEVPLAAGLADRLTEAGIKVFGPSAKAAQLESSKGFTKDLCHRYGIPTGAYQRFTDLAEAEAYIRAQGAPIVVKADGLAAGKGVVVAETVEQALAAVRDMLAGNRFGDAGASVVIEEFLVGEEASFFALCDGEHALPLVGAQDHSASSTATRVPTRAAWAPIRRPRCSTRHAAAEHGRDHPAHRAGHGGGRHPVQGRALCRPHDHGPGPQDLRIQLPLRRSRVPGADDAPEVRPAAGPDRLRGRRPEALDLRWSNDVALTVVMAAKGYPDAYQKGSEIRGLEAAARVEGVQIFHAGTRPDGARVLANGGRVLNVSALAPTVEEPATGPTAPST